MELIMLRNLRLFLILLLFRNVFGMTSNAPAEEEVKPSSTGAVTSTDTLNQPSRQEIEEEPPMPSSKTTNDTPSTSGTVVEETEPFIKGIEEPFPKTYDPFVMFENEEKVVPYQRSFRFDGQPKGTCIYYCPAEKPEDLKTSQTLCPHRQCLFPLKSTEEYSSSIKCKIEIVPYTRPLRENCGFQGTYSIGISVVLVLEETTSKLVPTESPDSDTIKTIVQTLSNEFYRRINSGISSFSQWFSREPSDLEKPLLDSEQSDVVEEQTASVSETDVPPSTTESKADEPLKTPISRKPNELETPLLESETKRESEITEESKSDQNSYVAPSTSQVLGELDKQESLQPKTDNQSDPSTSDSQMDAPSSTTRYKLLSVHLYQICIDRTLQSYHSLHVVPFTLLPRSKLYASYISEKGMDMLRKDYFTQHNLKLSYHNHNQIFHSNVQKKHTIVAQQLIPSEHQSSELWEKSTLFNINTAPLYLKFAELWNSIDKLLDVATRKFKSEILVYTGVLDLKHVAKSAELETLILIRTSIPLMVDENRPIITHSVPLVWYRIIGRPDSEVSLIIILINDYKKTKTNYKIKGCASVQEDSDWTLMINDYELFHHPNMIFCEHRAKIFSSKQEDDTFPKDILLDPANLILNIFHLEV